MDGMLRRFWVGMERQAMQVGRRPLASLGTIRRIHRILRHLPLRRQ